ncbi:unnamed protein product [Colias eurytheme]|nr:unnamed protein product [Colias eurytheme]
MALNSKASAIRGGNRVVRSIILRRGLRSKDVSPAALCIGDFMTLSLTGSRDGVACGNGTGSAVVPDNCH